MPKPDMPCPPDDGGRETTVSLRRREVDRALRTCCCENEEVFLGSLPVPCSRYNPFHRIPICEAF